MVDLKPHNLETYERVKEIFKTKNRACCVQPTGSGKSYLALKLFEDNPSARKLVLEPQHYIREQLQAKVTEDMGVVQFITYSKLAKMSDEDIAALEPDIIVLDEFHRAGAKEWGGKGVQRLLESYPESKVLGLSATPIRYLDSGRNMAEELFDGAMANNISLAEAIVRRILPLPRYITGLYCLNGEIESINKKIEQSYNNPEEKKALLRQVQEMKKQLDKSNGVSSILHKYILEPNGKYIVFCKDIKHLNQMKPMLEQWFVEAGFTDVRLYVVHSKNENKDAEFKKFKEDDGDGIRLCLVVSMLNEGVHVQGIDGVIMLRNTISAGLFFQQIGRAISCNSKGIPLILDLVANAQSVMECNLKKDIEMEIQKERERNKGFSSEGLDVEKFFVMDQVLDVISAFKGIEERLVDSWNVHFRALEQYKDREGDCLVPAKHIEVLEDGTKLNLGQWVGDMRKAKYGRGSYSLTKDREQQLEKMKFIWNVNDYNFDLYINALKQYKKRIGDCMVSKEHIEVLDDGSKIKLGQWVTIMRFLKRGRGDYTLTKEREQQLEKLGFIWEPSKFQFEKNVNDCIKFYEKNKRKPSQYSKDEEEKRLGSFWMHQKFQIRNSKLPLWKIELLNQIPDFNKVRDSQFDKFYKMTVEFIKRNGHTNIKRGDMLDGYKLGSTYNNLFTDYRRNKLSSDQIEKLKNIGIDITVKKINKLFKDKMELAQRAVSEGVLISKKNQFYQGVNLYNWYRLHKDKFSEEELTVINKLFQQNSSPVRIIEFKTNKVLNVSPSISQAAKVLCHDFNIDISEKSCAGLIRNRLTGKVKNPVYKGRFIFQYADSTDKSEPT